MERKGNTKESSEIIPHHVKETEGGRKTSLTYNLTKKEILISSQHSGGKEKEKIIIEIPFIGLLPSGG